ncbi:hypothetical protein QPK32_05495 [Massilia sp. YIM B02763]|uniref:hypothetical protein n=1 Tax=Massilia sp. YIM B02763 TaxID=3050130 RepID=UPI0025B685B4|nr:hypothetical protein [Massilia sp. YIM B02763]MDN4052520.1 hypothetical protein [Massilia sp. YIM B02763]
MIPAIGLMIGAYIITRMLDLLAGVDKKPAVKLFGVLTILVTMFCVYDVMNAGSKVAASMSFGG